MRHARCCRRRPMAVRWLTGRSAVFSTHQLAIPYRCCFFFAHFIYLHTDVRYVWDVLDAGERASSLCRRCLVLSITWIMLNSKLYLISNNLLLSVEGSLANDREPGQLRTQKQLLFMWKWQTRMGKSRRCASRHRLWRLCPFQTWSLFCVSRTVSDDVTLWLETLYIRHNLPSCSPFVMCRRAI